MINIRTLFILSITFFLIACSSTDKKAPTQQLSEQQYYEDAQKAISSNNYLLAIEHLQQLESRFPFGRYAEQAQLDLIYTYYKSLDYPAAQASCGRFIRLHPDHPSVDYAYYMRGLSSYSIDRGLLARFLPTQPSQRDMQPAKSSFAHFNVLVNKFPRSRYAPDACQRMIYLRSLLAENELYVAEYYMQRRAFLAAANRGRYVIENYQNTPSVPKGLAMMVKAYRSLELNILADDTLKILVDSYPDYDELENGKLVYETKVRNDERSWLSIISFGLVG